MRFSTQTVLWCVVVAQSVIIVVMALPKSQTNAAGAENTTLGAERKTRSRVERTSGHPTPPPPKGRRYFPPPSDPAWAKMAAKLNPESAKEMLERNKLEITNVEERAEKAWHIINQLCLNGFTGEAWELIDKDAGAVRQKGLGGFFRDADLPKAEILGRLNELQTADRSASLYGYWSRFSAEEFGKMDMTEFPLKSGFETGAFRRVVGDLLADSYDPGDPEASRTARGEVLAKVAEQINAGMFSYGEFAAIIQKDKSLDGFLFWEMTQKVDDQFKQGQRSFDGTDAQIIRLMTAQDPEKVLGMASTPDTKEHGHYHIALMAWLNKDYKGGEQWYNQHQSSLSEEDRDRSAVAFARANVEAGNHDTGEQWIGKIQSERWFNAVSYERNAIDQRKKKAQGQ
jgi:hypothetical protein